MSNRKKLGLRLKKFNDVNRKRLEKRLRSDFLSLLNDINKEFEFSFNFKRLGKKLILTLLTNFKLISKSRADLNTDLWNKNQNSIRIPSILKKLEEKYSQELGKKVKNIVDVFREQISKIIAEGKEKGTSYEDVANNLKTRIKDMSSSRAKTIALTETTTLTSNLDYAMATSAKMKNKTWIHAGGGKTDRPSHVLLDGTTVPIDGKFNVNGVLCEHTHDVVLPAGDVINCHCVTIYQ